MKPVQSIELVNTSSTLQLLMAWFWRTGPSVAAVLRTHSCVSSCLWANHWCDVASASSCLIASATWTRLYHDDVIKSKHFPRHWPFVRGIHRFPVNFPHKGQWRGALMFSLICVWINAWVNNREAGDLTRYRAHYHVIVMFNKKATMLTTMKPSTP